MQDVSCESLMLRLSENPQASLDIFRQSHHHPFGSCIYRKAINIDKHQSSFKFLSTTDCSNSPMLACHNPKATQRGVYTDKQSSMIVYRMKAQIPEYRLQRID